MCVSEMLDSDASPCGIEVQGEVGSLVALAEEGVGVEAAEGEERKGEDVDGGGLRVKRETGMSSANFQGAFVG